MGADTTNDAVRCRVDGRGVARVVLDQPDNRNALSQALVGGLLDAVDRCDESDVRVIVLGHTPPVFCAGADLRERRDGRIDSSGFVEVLQRLMTHRCPTIAAVEGPVRAGGIGLMAACDLVVVRPDTTFAFTEVRIGVAPAIISVPILERVPWTSAWDSSPTSPTRSALRSTRWSTACSREARTLLPPPRSCCDPRRPIPAAGLPCND
jgi:methylglutaconyl-CoA hydratase